MRVPFIREKDGKKGIRPSETAPESRSSLYYAEDSARLESRRARCELFKNRKYPSCWQCIVVACLTKDTRLRSNYAPAIVQHLVLEYSKVFPIWYETLLTAATLLRPAFAKSTKCPGLVFSPVFTPLGRDARPMSAHKREHETFSWLFIEALVSGN